MGRGPTLVDTGPLVSLLSSREKYYGLCWQTVKELPTGGLVAPIACFVEASYLLGKAGGYPLQRQLLHLIEQHSLRLHFGSPNDVRRMIELMDVYQDSPMDLADAAVVVAAESLKMRRVFTLDSHFYAYRCSDGSAFTVVPDLRNVS
jgi:predicted nucleic acid-binding protein